MKRLKRILGWILLIMFLPIFFILIAFFRNEINAIQIGFIIGMITNIFLILIALFLFFIMWLLD